MVEFKKMVLPSLVAGGVVAVFMSIISVIPLVNICGMGCCLYFLAGGVLAAFMLKRSAGAITLQDGAIVGVLSGAVYAIVATVFTVIFGLLGMGVTLATNQFGNMGGMAAAGAMSLVVSTIFAFLIGLFVGCVFYAIGGVIGAKLFEK